MVLRRSRSSLVSEEIVATMNRNRLKVAIRELISKCRKQDPPYPKVEWYGVSHVRPCHGYELDNAIYNALYVASMPLLGL